ncbi:MAG: cob(I)yrinic acid a,c-diamide adenosyltransferase [Pseudomonadota bacterium]
MSDDHKIKMQETQRKMRLAQKEKVHKRGVVIVVTGNGKGKSTSGFGTVLRAMGHGFNVGVIQFIKGKWKTGESRFFAEYQGDSVYYYAMETGFTWNTQDREGDILHAEKTWEHAEKCLQDDRLKVVMIDELTYMINYGYLDKNVIVSAIKARPKDQTVIITGRDACETLKELSDTFSEVMEVKHAYQEGIRAQKGVDF